VCALPTGVRRLFTGMSTVRLRMESAFSTSMALPRFTGRL
jgi:hypothetical protein